MNIARTAGSFGLDLSPTEDSLPGTDRCTDDRGIHFRYRRVCQHQASRPSSTV